MFQTVVKVSVMLRLYFFNTWFTDFFKFRSEEGKEISNNNLKIVGLGGKKQKKKKTV